VARVLKPFVGAALRRQAMADLVQSLKVLLARDGAAAVSVCGPPDLLEVLQARLEGSIADVTYHPDEGCDLRVTVGNTLLETRLGAWIAKIGEAAA
jgi:hypothetical protein